MVEALVLYPSPAMGHLISMVELGKLLLAQRPSLSVHILITTPPYNTGKTSPYMTHVATAVPAITFHHLPQVSTSTDDLNPTASVHHEALAFHLLNLQNPAVLNVLRSISQTRSVRALVMDFFCYAALSVANELRIPGYFFMTSGAATLALLLYLPKIHRTTTKSLKDLNADLDIPGLPPIPSTDTIKPILDRTDKAYECFLTSGVEMGRSEGLIVNTFDLLESRVIKAISEGLFASEDRPAPAPPIFCVGPMIADDMDSLRREGSSECIRWLDSQPSRSVVFLCFGSMGLFSVEQLREIALGLEKSGQRFLWVVRSPPTDDQSRRFLPPPEPDLDALLPEGFVDRTQGRGLVVKTWAPQVAVLSHGSVGGFVTHCGWNSVLEAVCAGVPMVAWPLYAEQRLNRVMLVREMKLALWMTESDPEELVRAEEVERRVRELMDSEDGEAIRERVLAMKEAAKAAASDGGSSRVALSRFIESWWLGGH